jgi:hypothetical protein
VATPSTSWGLEGVILKVCLMSVCRICDSFSSSDYVSSTLQYYCARDVLRSPTMWLGIFVGGYGSWSSFHTQMKYLTHKSP